VLDRLILLIRTFLQLVDRLAELESRPATGAVEQPRPTSWGAADGNAVEENLPPPFASLGAPAGSTAASSVPKKRGRPPKAIPPPQGARPPVRTATDPIP